MIVSKSTFLTTSFRNNIRVTNGLDPDDAQCFVGPDLGSNCLQMLSADDSSRQRINSITKASQNILYVYKL